MIRKAGWIVVPGALLVLAVLVARPGPGQLPAQPPVPVPPAAPPSPEAAHRTDPPALHAGPASPAAPRASAARTPSPEASPCDARTEVRTAGAALARQPAAAQAAALVADGRFQELAQWATQAGDAVTFALAWQACTGSPHTAACGQLRPEQWVQLDPDNAVAWLALADRAAEQGHGAAMAAALGRAGASTTARLHSFAAPSLLSAMAHGQQPGEAMAAAWRLAEQRPALTLPALLRQCDAARQQLDAGRQWQCSEAASALLSGAEELAVRAFAIELARSAGWPEQRLAPAIAEQQALEAVAGPPAQALGPVGCAAAWQFHAWARAQETEGEVPQLRQMMHALGHPPALWRARRLKEWALAVATAAAAAASLNDGP